MNRLAGWLLALVTGIGGSIASHLGRRAALGSLFITLFLAMAAAFYAALKAIVDKLTFHFPIPEEFLSIYYAIVPSNLDFAITTYITVKTLAWAFSLNSSFLSTYLSGR